MCACGVSCASMKAAKQYSSDIKLVAKEHFNTILSEEKKTS